MALIKEFFYCFFIFFFKPQVPMTDLGLKEIIQIDCGYITLSLNRDAA